MRGLWVRIHRYAGLTLALFLITAGSTGSIIAFHEQLDIWLNPEWFETGHTEPPLPIQQLVERLEQADHRLRVVYVPLATTPGRAARIQVQPRQNDLRLGFDEIFVDPATGAVLGQRLWGACCFDRRQLIPFLYVLHHSLHLPGNLGRWLLGSVALLWALDSIVGFCLTLPAQLKRLRSIGQHAGPSAHGCTHRLQDQGWWRRWRRAWVIKSRTGFLRRNWDLHRATGLWLWGIFMTMAISGVALNLTEELFEPVVSLLSPITPSPFDEREERSVESLIEPRISFANAVATAGAEAKRQGWRQSPGGAFYNAAYGIYGVHFGTEDAAGLGPSYVYIDAVDGRLLGTHAPGTGSVGDAVSDIQFPLHSGRIGGLPGRIVIAMTGIATSLLALTGIGIWLAKRRARATRPNHVVRVPKGVSQRGDGPD